jgi:catechol 2,3-dioxygenase-like lactoylglutathione lyase family enzyme
MHILQLEILTADIKTTERFYHEFLGFPVLNKQATEISFLAGNTTLIFRHTKNLQPVYHFAFNVACDTLHDAMSWISTQVEILDITPGIKIADFVNWNAKSFYFKDNNGNILEFIARFDLKEKLKDLDPKSVACISEIGIASSDMSNECDALIVKYGIPAFSKQPRLPNFAALGDDNGLLIFSSMDRNWYPTDVRVEKFAVKLLVENGNVKFEMEFPH